MGNKIYNIDLDEPITPLMVRDAVVECFWEAHCKDTELGAEDSETNKSYCKSIVEKAFTDTKGDFNHPTKESIVASINNLASFAKSFRDPTLIERHYSEIMQLVNKL
jgi:hypothetical protein